MPNGSIQVVTQDSAYPGAPQPMAGNARAQNPNPQFASFDNFNTVQVAPRGGGGNAYQGDVGLFSPGISSQLSQLTDRANTLLSSRSMVDNWRGRQLAKMRDRMMLSESAMANARSGQVTAGAHLLGSQASALRAANEVPIAQMHDYTMQRGQDKGWDAARLQAETSRYHTDVGAEVQTRAQDVGLLPHIGEAAAGQYEAEAIRKGDFESVRALTEARGKYPPRATEAKVSSPDAYGGVWVVEPGKKPYYQRPGTEDPARLEKKRKELGIE
jgi:hypothetical protein